MNRYAKTVRNIALSVVALLAVVVAAGLAYTWYMGENSQQRQANLTEPSGVSVRPKVEPRKVDPAGVVGASVQMLTSPITPGSNASIMVRTNPLATCVITVEYDKVKSNDSGLVQKKADEYGIVEWSWTVDRSVPLGTWPVNVTCANQKNSAMVRGDLKVVNSLD